MDFPFQMNQFHQYHSENPNNIELYFRRTLRPQSHLHSVSSGLSARAVPTRVTVLRYNQHLYEIK